MSDKIRLKKCIAASLLPAALLAQMIDESFQGFPADVMLDTFRVGLRHRLGNAKGLEERDHDFMAST